MECRKAVWGDSEVVWAGGEFFELGVCLLGCRQVARVLSELIWLKMSCLWLELTHRYCVSQRRAVGGMVEQSRRIIKLTTLGKNGMDETI